MTLTPHEQQQADTAAKAFAKTTLSSVPIGAPKTFVEDNKFKGFKAGITFALQHLLPGRMERFAEWIEKNAIQNPDDERFWYVDGEYCDHEELIAKYLQHLETLKQKEDVK